MPIEMKQCDVCIHEISSINRRVFCRIVAVLLALQLCSIAFAQKAQVTGRIIDMTEALVSGANVAITNTDTGAVRIGALNTLPAGAFGHAPKYGRTTSPRLS